MSLKRFRETIGRKIVKSLKREDDGLTYASIEFLNSLMQVQTRNTFLFANIYKIIWIFFLLKPMHSDYDLKQEQLNKSSLLSSKKFLEGLMEIFKSHVVSQYY